ncbi:MAG: chromosome segregation ATPase [Glaciecola sp.]|jgi:chromosome segregation ATPase
MSQNDEDFAPINIEVDERRPIGKTSPEPPESNSTSSGSNVLMSIALVVAIGASVGCIYLYTQLGQANTVAANTESRLKSLEQRLSATDEEMGNSTVALSVKVTELAERTEDLWGQMDKLWASAWRRNQEEIKTLNNDLASTKKNFGTDIKSIQVTLAEATTNVQQMLNRINGLNEKLSTQANDILVVNVNAEQTGEKVSNQINQIKALSVKVNSLESKNSTLLEKISDLESLLQEIAKKTI